MRRFLVLRDGFNGQVALNVDLIEMITCGIGEDCRWIAKITMKSGRDIEVKDRDEVDQVMRLINSDR